MNVRPSRRAVLAAAALPFSVGLPPAAAADPQPDALGFVPDPAFLERAHALLRRTGAIDLHAHPGVTFSRMRESPPEATFEARAAADMRAGLVTAASFAAVADHAVLERTPTGIVVSRDLRPGEALADYRRQMGNLHAMAGANRIRILRAPGDLAALVPGRDLGALLTVEGGDFLEEDAGRLTRAFDDGVRIITLIHYRPNAIGDNQTTPGARGLTLFGAEVVRQMNRLRMVIDVAHAAETTVRQVLARSRAPVLCSHTAIKSPAADHPRFLSAETARAVAAGGGLIGAWPSGIAATRLTDFVDRIFRIAETVGPDHTAIGTDMDANFQPVMTSYGQLPLVVSELLRRGYGQAETEALVAGNFRRVWRQVWSA